MKEKKFTISNVTQITHSELSYMEYNYISLYLNCVTFSLFKIKLTEHF